MQKKDKEKTKKETRLVRVTELQKFSKTELIAYMLEEQDARQAEQEDAKNCLRIAVTVIKTLNLVIAADTEEDVLAAIDTLYDLREATKLVMEKAEELEKEVANAFH